jgi:hypothetical protein
VALRDVWFGRVWRANAARVVAAGRIDANGAPTAAACGVELWSLKTLSDPQRALVKLRPKSTSVAAIKRLPMPSPTPSTRNTVFERRVWRVRAQIVEYKLEEDQDIHLVRRVSESRCGAATSSWRSLGAVVYISGVGFWDFAHGQDGHARNYAELHPVTGLRLVAGCS